MPPPTAAAVPPARPSPRQVLLGLFVVGQLAFLVLANLLGFFQDAQPYVPADFSPIIERVLPGYTRKGGQGWEAPSEVGTAVQRWAQLTGQDQQWSLFAPSVYEVTGFPAVVLTWAPEPQSAPRLARGLALCNAPDPVQAAASANLLQLRSDELQAVTVRVVARAVAQFAPVGPLEAAALHVVLPDGSAEEVTLPSTNEPLERHRFFRVGGFRLRRYEGYLLLYLTQREAETPQAARERWADAIRDHVGRHASAIEALLRWQVAAYRHVHPERPMPQQVILVERVYPILPPDQAGATYWRGPDVHPLARWQPAVTWQSEYQPIEAYNPVTGRFESIKR